MKKLKHISYGFLLFAVGATGLTSCKKEKLSPIPQTSLSDAVAFSSPDRIRQQVFGVYSAAKSGQFLGGRSIVYNEVRGEDWLNITNNGVTALGVWNFSIVSSDNQTENQWSAGYAAINRANVVLEGIDANPTVIPQTLANQYKAEARFMRAVSYYYLANLYGRRPFTADNGASLGIPLRLTAAKSNAGTDLVRAPMSEVYNQIIADLNYAETNLPLTYGTSADSNLARAHRNSAIAFKTRVYLSMGRYADVITEANKIVPTSAPFVAPTGVQHRLMPSILTPFRTFTSNGNQESIFALPMSQNSAPGTQNGLASYWNAEFALNPSGALSLLGASDARRTNFVVAGTNVRYSKYNDDNNNYVQVMRYSEVLLNLAEALARTSTTPDVRAIALLNAVRQRSEPATVLAPATQQALIDAILLERRLEFLSEGLRSLDIMRLNQTFPAKGSVSAVPPTSLSYVWPIPASEILYNKLAVQNQ